MTGGPHGRVLQGATAIVIACVAAAAVAVGRIDASSPATNAQAAPAPPLSSARGFVLDEVQAKLDGRWSRAWSSLFPLHQRVAVKAVYVRCERATPFLSQTRAFGILRVRRALVHVPGLSRSLPGAAVTLRVALGWYGPRDPIVLTPTLHVVAIGGRWRWLLSGESYLMYRHAACGSLPPV
ncbi:MAG TPA: hypothetical protein VGI10_09655 [Polyangiaceae bacterium]|jgi:hypothetical protein